MGGLWRWRRVLGSFGLLVLDKVHEQLTFCGRRRGCYSPSVAGAELLSLDMSIVHPQTGQGERHQAAEQGKEVPEKPDKDDAGGRGRKDVGKDRICPCCNHASQDSIVSLLAGQGQQLSGTGKRETSNFQTDGGKTCFATTSSTYYASGVSKG